MNELLNMKQIIIKRGVKHDFGEKANVTTTDIIM